MTAPRIFAPEYYTHMRALEAEGWWNAAMRDTAARLLQQAGLPPTGVLLDAGCASGQTMEWFRAEWPGWRTIGVDLAMDGLRAARTVAANRVAAGSVLALPLADQSVDTVITLDVLQHLPLQGGAGTALTEFRRVLRPGGWMVIRTNAQAWPRIPDDPEHSFHKFSARELRALLTSNGFRVARLGRVNGLLGLAEIPREWRGQRQVRSGYVGHLAGVPTTGPGWRLKRRWLGLEGRLLASGASLPLGRTLLALVQREEEAL
jgi:ubiquinone/menaquinone biosynthesis C-methylase UbiE